MNMSIGNDRNWMVAGTNTGYVTLWDLRFHKIVKAWQHNSCSPVHKVSTSFAALGRDHEPQPHVIMSCGKNETSIFNVMTGECNHCFRVLDPSLCYVDRGMLPEECTSLPRLREVALHSNSYRRVLGISHAVQTALTRKHVNSWEPHMNSFSGRVGSSGQNYLITAGSDASIRYWDFSSASKCFTVSGLKTSQSHPVYESIDVNDQRNSLILCRQLPAVGVPKVGSHYSNNSKYTNHGPVRPENRHRDSILDIKKLEYPIKGLVTCSRDGFIKFWR